MPTVAQRHTLGAEDNPPHPSFTSRSEIVFAELTPLSRTPATAKTLIQGQITVGATATRPTDESTPVYGVLIQAANGNGGTVYVGTDSANQYIELAAGEGIFMPVANLVLVWISASTAGQTVNYIATTKLQG